MKTTRILTSLPKTKTESEPTGILFYRGSIIFLSGVLFIALVQNFHSFTVGISLILALAFIAKIISQSMLSKVHCNLSLSQRHFFPDDSAAINIEIANKKIIPLFWAHAEIAVSRSLTMTADNGIDDSSPVPELAFDFSLNSFSAARFRPSFLCRRRGYYPLKNLTLISGDMFGLYEQKARFPSEEAIIVYPRLYPLKDLNILSLYPTGGVSFREQLFHDHTRTMGVRDYCVSDEFRHIHWRASARRDRLQVKVFEPTTTGQLTLFLPREEFAGKEEWETAICVLAALAHKSVSEGNSVGLFSNCASADTGKPVSILPDGNKDGIDILLTALAKVNFRAGKSWQDFFPSILNQLRGGTTFIFAAVQFNEAVRLSILNLRQAGYKVLVFNPAGGKDNPLQGEVPVYKYEILNGYIQCEPQQ